MSLCSLGVGLCVCLSSLDMSTMFWTRAYSAMMKAPTAVQVSTCGIVELHATNRPRHTKHDYEPENHQKGSVTLGVCWRDCSEHCCSLPVCEHQLIEIIQRGFIREHKQLLVGWRIVKLGPQLEGQTCWVWADAQFTCTLCIIISFPYPHFVPPVSPRERAVARWIDWLAHEIWLQQVLDSVTK